MEKVINLGIPHVGEQVFRVIDDNSLIQFIKVCSTWKVLAENVLYGRWKQKFAEACKTGKTDIVRIFLERCDSEDNQLNAKVLRVGHVRGLAPFSHACFNGHAEIVKLLLHYSDVKNIDLNATDPKQFEFTGFAWACLKGHLEVVKLLLEHSGKREIDFNAKIVHSQVSNAGHLAFLHSELQIVQLLMEYADIKGIDIPRKRQRMKNVFTPD